MSDLTFVSTNEMIDEIFSREATKAVLIRRLSGASNQQDDGKIVVEISPGLNNKEARELLEEVYKALSHAL